MRTRNYPRHSIEFGWRELLRALVAKGSVDSFEERFARYIGTCHAVAIPSCRFGIYHYLRQRWPEPGDASELLLPAYTFSAVPAAVRAAHLRPIFIDSEKDGFNLDVTLLERAVSSRTRGILVSHLYGNPCGMAKVLELARKHGLKVIEDCAHACGSTFEGRKLGSLGDVGFFSFGIGKNLSTAGGGMMVTDDPGTYRDFKSLVAGLPEKPRARRGLELLAACAKGALTNPPFFSLLTLPLIRILCHRDINRLDALLNEEPQTPEEFREAMAKAHRFSAAQAAIGAWKLDWLDRSNEAQSRHAEYYDRCLAKAMRLNAASAEAGRRAAPYYVLRVAERDRFRRALLAQGIDTKPCDMSNCGGPSCRNADTLQRSLLEIPNSRWISKDDLDYIAKTVNQEHDALGG